MYRNEKLKKSARDAPCVSCGIDNGTTVWAHSNELKHGKGTGIKAHDIFGAYLCYKCHSDFDQSRILDRKEWFRIMWEKSLIYACNNGKL